MWIEGSIHINTMVRVKMSATKAMIRAQIIAHNTQVNGITPCGNSDCIKDNATEQEDKDKLREEDKDKLREDIRGKLNEKFADLIRVLKTAQDVIERDVVYTTAHIIEDDACYHE